MSIRTLILTRVAIPSTLVLACAASTPPTRPSVLVPTEAVVEAAVLAQGVSGYGCYRQGAIDGMLEAARLAPPLPFNWTDPVQLALETTPGAEVLLNPRFASELHERFLWTETCTFMADDAGRLR